MLEDVEKVKKNVRTKVSRDRKPKKNQSEILELNSAITEMKKNP